VAHSNGYRSDRSDGKGLDGDRSEYIHDSGKNSADDDVWKFMEDQEAVCRHEAKRCGLIETDQEYTSKERTPHQQDRIADSHCKQGRRVA